MTGVSCLSSLGLDEYSFDAVAEGGSSGAAGSDAGGNAGSAGAAGTQSGGGSGGAGSGGSAGTDAGGSGGDAGSLDTPDAAAGSGGGIDAGLDGSAPLECAPGERCVPEIPSGWQGPLAVSAGGVEACPSVYPNVIGEVNADLVVGAASCGCGCNVGSATCRLFSKNLEDFFAPVGSCDSPPEDDDCLTAVTDANCVTLPSTSISPSDWDTTEVVCGGAAATGLCAEGSCYPAPSGSGFGPVCITSAGALDCPDGFPVGASYFLDFVDNRSCSACTCSVNGDCTVDLEICSVGFFQVTLNEGDEQCLNSSDGDSVTLLSSSLGAPTCNAIGGTLQGAATPVDPITVCCME